MVFKNKHGELRSGWMLALLMLSYFALSIIIGGIAGTILLITGNFSDIEAVSDYLTFSPVFNTIIYPTQISVALLLFWLVYKRPLKQVGFYKADWIKQLLLGALFGIVFISFQVLILSTTGMGRMVSFEWGALTSGLFWSGILFFLYVGFFEEILFRGVMMTALKTTRNKWIIILVSSAIFGLVHSLNPNVTVFSVANLILAGAVFAYLFIRTGRLWAPIGLHITWNSFMGNIYGIRVSGLTLTSIGDYEFTGPAWFTGGEFGLEGGLLCTITMVLALLFIHFGMKQAEGFWGIDTDMPLTRG